MCNYLKPKKTNYGKIIAITLAVVAGVSAIAFVIAKLFGKYFICCDCDCGCDCDCDCDCGCDCGCGEGNGCDCECEECGNANEAEEAKEAAEA